jgi:hypothetical protein
MSLEIEDRILKPFDLKDFDNSIKEGFALFELLLKFKEINDVELNKILNGKR